MLLSLLLRRLIGRRARRAFLQRRGQFDCGVRMVDGSLPGEGRRWRHRISSVHDGVLEHGRYRMELLLMRECENPGGFWLDHSAVVWEARTPDSSATVQLASMPHSKDQIMQLPMAGAQRLPTV